MEIVWIMLIALAVSLILGVPIAFSIGIGTFVGLLIGGIPTELLGQGAFTALNNYAIMAVPFFILTGMIMESGGLSKRLIDFAKSIVGNVTGGFGIVTVIACGFFAAISGSSPATVAAIGTIMIPMMVKNGYSKGFASSITATAGGLGVIIPPSITMIVYAVIADVSVSDMFLSGIVPGIVTVIFICLTVFLIAKKTGIPGDGNQIAVKEVLRTFWAAKWALMAPVIILGGIYSGVFTPTESGVIAVVYGLIIGLFVYKELKWKDIPKVLIDAGIMTGAVLIILSTATTLGRVFTLQQVPQILSDALLSITESPYIILLLIAGIMIVLGTFMEALSLVIILTPIFIPVVIPLGVDPVHFGIILIIGAVIGMMTPPVGVNLFVASGISGVSIERLTKSMAPFYLTMILLYLVIIFIPILSTGLVEMFR
ncbi:TRAP transporter large permease [Planococcus beigongshangi]|uniref:TRAP transporter large permease n=1 Tax=Planococcus beigongshangi TaxID=2782536 RepID=UPI00193C606E|nr:TRAP transporter large permease [Planococcus beigongshangi]